MSRPTRSREPRATVTTTESSDAAADRALLTERAAALAVAGGRSGAARNVVQVAAFTLASERYAVEVGFVREVVRLAELTLVPGTPDFVMGLTTLRGEVLAIFDLRRLLGVPVRGVTDLSRVVVLGAERAEFGVLADTIIGLVDLDVGEVLEPAASLVGRGRSLVRGVTRDALVLLDGAALLGDSSLYIEQRTETAT